MNAAKLTKNPTLITALLSALTIVGYVGFRLAWSDSDTDTEASAAAEAEWEALAGAVTNAAAQARTAAETATGSVTETRFANDLPAIVLDDLAGIPTPLSTWSDKPMLVNFWATWCAPCLREIPLLKAFHDATEAIEVIGIAVDRAEPVLEFAAGMEFNYPVLIGQAAGYDAMAVFRNEAQVMPFTAFTAPGGAVLGVHYGELHPEHLENFAITVDLLGSGGIDLEAARDRIANPELAAAH